jgi:hypothetical protein
MNEKRMTLRTEDIRAAEVCEHSSVLMKVIWAWSGEEGGLEFLLS